MGGGLFPTFTQFTVYKTNTHIYSQAIHVPDGGGGLAARAKRPGPAQTGQCETIHNPASAPCALVQFAAHENSSGSNGKPRAKTPQQTASYGQQTCTVRSMGIFQGPVFRPCALWWTGVYSLGRVGGSPPTGSAAGFIPSKLKPRPEEIPCHSPSSTAQRP